jgi:tetratricopeptide (TPR) repeat protein
MNTGRSAESIAQLRRALDTAATAGDRRSLLHATNNLGLAHWRSGDHRQAVTCWQQAVPVAQEIGDKQNAGIVIGNMGEVYLAQGEYYRATRCFTFALRTAVELRDWASVADQLANAAAIASVHDRADEAERLLDRAIALARFLDTPYFLCAWLHRLAEILVGQGRLDEADRLNTEALDVAATHNESETTTRAQALSIRLQVELGRMDARVGADRIRSLDHGGVELHERAVLLDTLWQLEPTREIAHRAAELHRLLHERAPSVAHRQSYRRLTGETLPPAPPLPPLPEAVESDPVELEELLQEVDEAVRRLGLT